jgi:hypothetical protein
VLGPMRAEGGERSGLRVKRADVGTVSTSGWSSSSSSSEEITNEIGAGFFRVDGCGDCRRLCAYVRCLKEAVLRGLRRGGVVSTETTSDVEVTLGSNSGVGVRCLRFFDEEAMGTGAGAEGGGEGSG